MITRQALLKKIVDAVNNLPDAKLQQTWDQVDSWDAVPLEYSPIDPVVDYNSAEDKEVVEFEVTLDQNLTEQFVRLPIRSKKSISHVIMESNESAYIATSSLQRLKKNVQWWNQNSHTICNDPSLYGRYVAISDGVVFSSDSYWDAYNKARRVHTNGAPYIFFLKYPHRLQNHAN